ncbi:MAG TPA: DUF4215 domain-containing protein, partial [Nannocystis exedens]|nr:DUF4215 domain-containing protein [Nannocystis exedens]
MTRVCSVSPLLLILTAALLGACPPTEGDSSSEASATQSTSDAPTSSSSSSTTNTSTGTSSAAETTASQSFCGDGVLDSGEECDDGNISDADGCLANCTPGTCGDGHLWIGTE